MDEIFSVMFEPQSLNTIEKFAGWQAIAAPELQAAGDESADLIIQQIGTTQWMNGGTTLNSSFYQMESSPYNVIITSDLPYSRRRNWGFDGPDSLGRVYHDQPTFFVENAISAVQDQIENSYVQHLDNAFNSIGGGQQ